MNLSARRFRTGLRRWRDTRGFSLIELMTVLVILSIVAAATLPAARSSLVSRRLDNSAKSIESKFRLVRARAIAENVPYVVLFDMSTDRWGYFRDANSSGGYDAGDTWFGVIDLPDNIDLYHAAVDPVAGGSYQFNPDGSTSAGGTLVVANEKGVRLAIQVLQSSGMIHILTEEDYGTTLN